MLAFLVLALIGSAAARKQFVVGGQDTTIEEFPWQGSLRTAAGSHNCGCVYVGGGAFAVTAAHCTGGAASTEWGMTDRGDGQTTDINAAINHPSYGTGDGAFPNDIAVLELADDPANLGATAVPLASERNEGTDADSFISGWGRTTGGGALPTTLQMVEIPIISDDECSEIWGTNYNGAIHICIYDSVNQDKGACNGDSGGPLVSTYSATATLEGITSWGATGCSTSFASSYSRIYNDGSDTDLKAFVCENIAAAEGC